MKDFQNRSLNTDELIGVAGGNDAEGSIRPAKRVFEYYLQAR